MQQFDDIFLLMRYFSFVRYLSLGVTLLALVYLRFKDPQRFRPIRMPIGKHRLDELGLRPFNLQRPFIHACLFYTVLPILMTTYCLLIVGVILYNDLNAVIFLLCGIATGTPIYIVMTNMEKISKYSFFKEIFQLTIGMQKLLMVVSPHDD